MLANLYDPGVHFSCRPLTMSCCCLLLITKHRLPQLSFVSRLNQFSLATFGSHNSLPTLSSCRFLHSPKARYPVVRAVTFWRGTLTPSESRRVAHVNAEATKNCRRYVSRWFTYNNSSSTRTTHYSASCFARKNLL